MICYAVRCPNNMNGICKDLSNVVIDEDGYCENLEANLRTICGEIDCEGCLYQHLNLIELCEKEARRKMSIGV